LNLVGYSIYTLVGERLTGRVMLTQHSSWCTALCCASNVQHKCFC